MFPKKLFAEPQLYGELDDRGRLNWRADFRHWALFFLVYFNIGMSQRDIIWTKKKKKQQRGSDDKTKIVLFEFYCFHYNITIHGNLVESFNFSRYS